MLINLELVCLEAGLTAEICEGSREDIYSCLCQEVERSAALFNEEGFLVSKRLLTPCQPLQPPEGFSALLSNRLLFVNTDVCTNKQKHGRK